MTKIRARAVRLLSIASACVVLPAMGQAQTLAWDHPSPSTVTGYRISVDGTRTDYGLRVAGAGGACGCQATLTLTPGDHAIAVSAYNAGGETWTSPITVTVPGSTTPPPASTLPAPWLTQDIGAVGATGSTAVSGAGVFTVSGAGADIWGTTDAFRSVYQTVTGDLTLVARVSSIQNTDTYAKAGLMIRDGSGPNAAHVIVNVRPNGVVEFLRRGAAGASTQVIATTTSPVPVWLRLQRRGTTVTAAVSRDGVTWTGAMSTALSVASTVQVGLAVCSHVAGTLNRSTFDAVAVTPGTPADTPSTPTPTPTPTTGPVPAPWTNQDVGTVNLSGSATYSNGTFSVTGAGADIWDTTDAFHYVTRPFTGDGSITARVVSLQNTNTFAKAGIMLRASTSATSRHVILDVRPNGAVEFMVRPSGGASTTFLAAAGQTPPAWLRLTRSGTRVVASVSTDGTSWTAIGAVDVSGLVLGGLVVTSHDPNQRNTAVFDRVTVAGN